MEKKNNNAEYNFLRLFITTMCIRGERERIIKHELEEKLGELCDEDKYKRLFKGINIIEEKGIKRVNLNSGFKDAYEKGLLVMIADCGVQIPIIGLTTELAVDIIRGSDEKDVIDMSRLYTELKSNEQSKSGKKQYTKNTTTKN